MPTYEYLCDGCGHRFDHFQSMNEARLKKCPNCSKPRLRRLIGAGGGVIFKGSGFYATDYRSEAYKQKAKSEDASPAAGKEGGKPTPTPSPKDSPPPSPPPADPVKRPKGKRP